MKNSSEAIFVVSAGAVNTGIAEEFLPTRITKLHYIKILQSCEDTYIFKYLYLKKNAFHFLILH